MQSKSRSAPLVLFFDCYIVSSRMTVEEAHSHRDSSVGNLIRDIRMTATAYHHVSKLDEVRYTLLSYRAVPWAQIFLRVECEDEEDRADFFAFARCYFPDANTVNQRSATAVQYVESLTPLKNMGDPWVFFSPNNDHPLIGDPDSFAPLLELAEEIEPLYPSHFICVQYSHFTETQNSALPDQHNWSRMMGNTHTMVGETSHAHIVQSILFSCDSIKIYRLSALLTIFSKATNTERCIRLEDTGIYLSEQYREVNIWPKTEICRHYDGYPHVERAPAPLFIPQGFFESNIKIRYGFDDSQAGYVNVNPYEDYSYRGGCADVRSLLSELPVFWKERISSVETDPGMQARYADRIDEAFQFGAIRNPYGDTFVLTNYMRSAWNAAGNKAKEFNGALCQATPFTIPAGLAMMDMNPATTTSVYFVLSGVITQRDWQFRKHDFFVFQGEAQYTMQAGDADAKVLKVIIQIPGPRTMRFRIWRRTKP